MVCVFGKSEHPLENTRLIHSLEIRNSRRLMSGITTKTHKSLATCASLLMDRKHSDSCEFLVRLV